jgi:hypothetical protein
VQKPSPRRLGASNNLALIGVVAIALVIAAFVIGRMSAQGPETGPDATPTPPPKPPPVATAPANPPDGPTGPTGAAQPTPPGGDPGGPAGGPPPGFVSPEGVLHLTVYGRECTAAGQCGEKKRIAATVEVADPGGVFDRPKATVDGPPVEFRLPWGPFDFQAIDAAGHKSEKTRIELLGGKTLERELVIDVVK